MCAESMKLLCEGGLHLVCMSAESLELACERDLLLVFTLLKLCCFFFFVFLHGECCLGWE